VTIYRFRLTFADKGALSYLIEYLSAFIAIARLSWRIWNKERFDIIHFCNPPDIFFPIALFYRMLGARVVFDHHDLFPEMIKSRFHGLGGRFLQTLARVSEFLTFRVANIVISTNESYRRIAIERGGRSEDHVFVVRNGPKIDQFVPVEPDPAIRRGYAHVAGYAGAMHQQDGVLELISVIRHIVHEMGRHDILFLLLGDGVVRPQALANVKAWGLESYVDMPGMILDRQILRRYMSSADLLLSPEPLTPFNAHSTFLKIGEYMAMGKPIVAFDLTETRYTAQEAAVYVPPDNIHEFGEAIVTLLDNPERRKRMGEVGRQRIIHRLGWEYQQQNLFRAYETALADPRRQRR